MLCGTELNSIENYGTSMELLYVHWCVGIEWVSYYKVLWNIGQLQALF